MQKKLWFFWSAIILAIVVLTVITWVALAGNRRQIPVLLYHQIVSSEEAAAMNNGAVISFDEFAAQMEWLRANNYETITLNQLLAWMQGQAELPPKPILITFDDGYRSFKTYAFPVLEELNLRAVVFIIGSLAGEKDGDLVYLNWADMRILNESGLVEFQNHSYSGHGGTAQQPDLLSWNTEEILFDLKQSEDVFRSEGIPKPFAFAYPFGAQSPIITDALAQAGYKIAFTTKQGLVNPNDNPLLLKRITIWPGTSLPQFEKRVTGQRGVSFRAHFMLPDKSDR